MARDVTGTDVAETLQPKQYVVIAEVNGINDIAKLPATALTPDKVNGLTDQLASKANVGHTHPPTDPGDAATKDYVDEKYAAGVAQLVTLDARVTGVENTTAATAGAVAAITPNSIGAIANTQRGVPNGVATLGSDGLVPSSQLPSVGDVSGATPNATAGTIVKRDGSGRTSIIAGTAADHAVNKAQMEAADAVVSGTVTSLSNTVSGLTAGSVGAIPTSEKGAANGVATLGADGLVTPAQLPAAGGSIALTDKGAANGVATLDSNGKHVLTELQDGSAVDVTSTPYTLTRAPGAVRAKSGAARVVLPKTGSTKAPMVINDTGGLLEVIADEGVVANGVKGGASRATAEYAGIPVGLSATRRGFTCSWWGYLDTSATQQRVISGYRDASTAYFELGLLTNAIGFRNANASGSTLNSVVSSWTPTDGLHHFMMAADLTTSTFQLYIDGTSQATEASPTWSNTDISWGTTKFAVCNVTSDAAATNGWLDDIYQVWFDDQFIDLSVSGNRLKFYNAGPVNLGHNGWRPTGSAPALFFNDTTFLKNLAAPAEVWAAVSGRGSFGATTHSITGTSAAAVIVDASGASVSSVTLANKETAAFSGASDGLTWRQASMGGGLSSADRTKLDSIESGAQVNPAALSNAAIDAGTATTPSTITAAGLKRGVVQHAVSGIGSRAITAAMLPSAGANTVKGNASGTPGDIADIPMSTLATAIGSAPVDQLVAHFLATTASTTVTNPGSDRSFATSQMTVWDAKNALTVVFFGEITTAAPAGTKIALAYESPIGAAVYYWFDGTSLGTSGSVVTPVDETAAGVVDASVLGDFYQVVTVPSVCRSAGKLKYGWKHFGGNGTGSLVVKGAALRVNSMIGTTGGVVAVQSFNGRTGAVTPQSGDYNADQIADGSTKVMMTAAERTQLAGVVSVGSTAAEWFSNDPSLANGGLKGSNTAAQNGAAIVDLMNRMAASPAARKRLVIKPVDRGVFDVIGSFSLSGYDQGLGSSAGANIVIDFATTQFNLQGARTDYNQIRRLSGTWQELDAFTAGTTLPYPSNSDIIDATRKYRKQAVFLDVRGCPNLVTIGSLTINGNNAAGVVAISSSGNSPVGSGCAGAVFEQVIIKNVELGMFADLSTGSHVQVFHGTSWDRLSMSGVTRGFVIGNNQANMMSIAQLDIEQSSTSYLFGSQLRLGAARIRGTGPSQLAIGATGWVPAPKAIEISQCSLQVGSLQGEASNALGSYCTVNVANEGVLDVGVLHQDNGASSATQSGCSITMCQDDAAHIATLGTISIGGVAGSSESLTGNSGVVGLPAIDASARSIRMAMLGRATLTMTPMAIIPDYRSAAIGGGTSSTFESLQTFSGREGQKTRRISAGSFVEVTGGGGGLIGSVSSEFSVVSGQLALARLGRRARYTTASTIGQNEEIVIVAPSAAATFTLTTDTNSGTIAITNRGSATATIVAGSGQTLRGGSISLTAAATDADPSTICLARDPADNSWRLI